jgi:hypothetical protein
MPYNVIFQYPMWCVLVVAAFLLLSTMTLAAEPWWWSQIKETQGFEGYQHVETIDEFPWMSQSGVAFNEKTYDFLNQVLRQESDGTLKLDGSQSLDNFMLDQYSKISYHISDKDMATQNQRALTLEVLSSSIVETYERIFGEISPEQITEAKKEVGSNFMVTRFAYIADYKIAYIWSCRAQHKLPPLKSRDMQNLNFTSLFDMLPCIPASAAPVGVFFAEYLLETFELDVITASLGKGALLRQLIHNIETPTLTNGGIEVGVVPAPTIRPGFKIDSPSTLYDQLVYSKRKILASFRSQNQIPLNMSCVEDPHCVSSKTSMIESYSMDVEFDRYAFVHWRPNLFDSSTMSGWFSPEIIREAWNDTHANTGYHYIMDHEPKASGYVDAAVISRYPLINVTISVYDLEEFAGSIPSNATLNLHVAGFPNPFVTNDYVLNHVRSTVHFSFSPPMQVISVPSTDQTAFIIAMHPVWIIPPKDSSDKK